MFNSFPRPNEIDAISPSNVVGDIVLMQQTGNSSVSGTGETESSRVIVGSSFVVNYGGSVRVKFGLNTNTTSTNVNARIYKNGSPVGILRTTESTSPITYTEDFYCNAGDEFVVYAWASGALPQVRDIKLCGKFKGTISLE